MENTQVIGKVASPTESLAVERGGRQMMLKTGDELFVGDVVQNQDSVNVDIELPAQTQGLADSLVTLSPKSAAKLDMKVAEDGVTSQVQVTSLTEGVELYAVGEGTNGAVLVADAGTGFSGLMGTGLLAGGLATSGLGGLAAIAGGAVGLAALASTGNSGNDGIGTGTGTGMGTGTGTGTGNGTGDGSGTGTGTGNGTGDGTGTGNGTGTGDGTGTGTPADQGTTGTPLDAVLDPLFSAAEGTPLEALTGPLADGLGTVAGAIPIPGGDAGGGTGGDAGGITGTPLDAVLNPLFGAAEGTPLEMVTAPLADALGTITGSIPIPGAGGGDTGGSTGPTGTPLDAVLGPLAGAAGGAGGGETTGPTGTPLDAVLGPLAGAAGGAGGGETTGPTGTPLDLALSPLLDAAQGTPLEMLTGQIPGVASTASTEGSTLPLNILPL